MSEEQPKRKEDGTFAKGQSGNAGGRTQWEKELREAIRTRFHDKGLPVIDKIFERATNTSALERVINSPDSPDDNVLRAEKALTERLEQAARVTLKLAEFALPKPVQKIEVDEKKKTRPLENFTTEDMRNLQTVLKAAKDTPATQEG